MEKDAETGKTQCRKAAERGYIRGVVVGGIGALAPEFHDLARKAFPSMEPLNAKERLFARVTAVGLGAVAANVAFALRPHRDTNKQPGRE